MNGRNLMLTNEEFFDLIFNFEGAGRLMVHPGTYAVRRKLDYLTRTHQIDPITRSDAVWFLNHERERGSSHHDRLMSHRA